VLGSQPNVGTRLPCNERAMPGFISGSTTVSQTFDEPHVIASTASTDSGPKLASSRSECGANGQVVDITA
jgi:hypothetical protein